MARNIFTKGTAITLAWHFTKPDGSSFDLSGYSLRLFYAVGSRYTEVQGFSLGTNATSGFEDFISWVFAADKQFTAGDYKMKLQLYQNGKLFTTFNYNDAFALYQGTPYSSNDEQQTEEAGVVNLYTAAEFYLFNPIIPVVGSDGFWYVDGVRVLDGSDNPVPSYYDVRYDEDTRWLSIYKGNPDDPGTPEPDPIQVIKDVDDALKHWNEQYLAEEGSLAESEAGDDDRWGQYKMNEGTLDGSEAGDSDRWGQYQSNEAERNAEYAAAEGTSSSSSSENSRWGEYKAAESTRNVQYTQQEGSKAGSSAGGSDRWGQYKAAEAARDAERLTAEGTSSSSASENSRWGKYKAAENARDAARLTAEGNSGSTAGDGSRWGTYKTAENSRDAARLTAEGSAASTAGDGSRWGAYKTAEATRDTARETAEGSASSEAGDGTRWGAYKTAEANRNTARETAEGSSSSTAGDGSRWGAYKTAEAARNAAYADEEGSLAGSSATDNDRWGKFKANEEERNAAMAPLMGYFSCATAAATAAKEVTAADYILTSGGSVKIKFTYANSASSPTLNINSKGAKAIVYNGAVASATNTWAAGDVVEFYYDPTYNSNAGAYVGIPTVVSVSQNTSTGHTNISVGGETTELPSLDETLKVEFVDGGGWNNGSVGSVPAFQTNASFSSIKTPCVKGNVFNIKGQGGENLRLCATLDADGKVVRVVSSATTLTELKVTIAEGEEYITVNALTENEHYCYRSGIQSNISELYAKIEQNQNAYKTEKQIYNLNIEVSDTIYTANAARTAVPANVRKLGLIITYKIATRKYVVEQYVGSSPQSSSTWADDYNWEFVKKQTEDGLPILEPIFYTISDLGFSKYGVTNLIAGHKYRVYLNNKNVTVGSSGIVFCINTQPNTTNPLVSITAGTTLSDYYDVTMPSDKSELYVGVKCSDSEEFLCSVEDITASGMPYYLVAHTSSTNKEKEKADYVVTDSNAATKINELITSMTGGGTIKLASGTYSLSTYIDLQGTANISLVGTGNKTKLQRVDSYLIRTNSATTGCLLSSLICTGAVTFKKNRGNIWNCWINGVFTNLNDSLCVKEVLPSEGMDGIIAAIDELPSTGGLILLKEGTYQGATAITFPNNKTNIRIVGVGVATILERYNVNPEVEARNTAISGCSIENLKVAHSIRRDILNGVPSKMLRVLNCYIGDTYINEPSTNIAIIECGEDRPITTLKVAYENAITYARNNNRKVEIHIFGNTSEDSDVVIDSAYVDIVGHKSIVEFNADSSIKFTGSTEITVKDVHFKRTGCTNVGNNHCCYVSNPKAKFINCIFENATSTPSPFNQADHDYGYEDPAGRRRHGILVEIRNTDDCTAKFINCVAIGSPYGTNSCRGWYVSYGNPKLFNCIGYGGGIGEYGHGLLCHRASHPELHNCIGYAGNRSYRRAAGIRMQAAGSPTMIGCIGYGNCNLQYKSNGVPYATLHSKCQTLGITDESFFYNGSSVDYNGLTPVSPDDGYNANRKALLNSIEPSDIDIVALSSQATGGYGISLWTGSQNNQIIDCVGYAGGGEGSCGMITESKNNPDVIGGYYGIEHKTDYNHFTNDGSSTDYMTLLPEGVTPFSPYVVDAVVIVSGTQAYIDGDYIKIETDESTPQVLCNVIFANDNINILPITRTAIPAGKKLKISIVNNGSVRRIANDSFAFKVGFYYNANDSYALSIGGSSQPQIKGVTLNSNDASPVVNIESTQEYNIINSVLKTEGEEYVIVNGTENPVRVFNSAIKGNVPNDLVFASANTINGSTNIAI